MRLSEPLCTISRSMVGLLRHLTTLPLIWAGTKNVCRAGVSLGIVDAIRHFSQQADRYMVHSIEEEDLTKMRMHERVGLAVETRLNFLEPHKETVHRGMTWLAMPQNSMLGARLLYQTVDDIWYAVGDRSADFSFYTKRGLLRGRQPHFSGLMIAAKSVLKLASFCPDGSMT